jgi:hypothetical protein
MTTISAFCDPAQPDLQALLDAALQNEKVLPRRGARLRAAVAAFARLMGRPAGELPAHQGFIIQQMRRFRRKPTTLSPKTLSNTRSELLYLVKTGRGRGPRSSLLLSQEWAEFREALQRGPAWWSLSRLAGYSSRQAVLPSDVSDGHVAGFLEALQRSAEVADPEGHVRRVIRTWNRLAANNPALHISPLTLSPQQQNRWTLPESAFLQSFRADVERWFRRITSDDPLASGPARPLRPATIRTRRHQIYKAASALVLSGHPAETVRSLADLVTPEAFQALLRHLLARQGNKRTEALHSLAGGLLAIARHYVRVEKEAEVRLARIVKSLDSGADGFRSKTRQRLAAFEDDRHVSALLHLPTRLLAEAKTARSARHRKRLAEMAIAVEVLLFAPVRVGNLVSLRLEVTFQRIALGREKRWLIERGGPPIIYSIEDDFGQCVSCVTQGVPFSSILELFGQIPRRVLVCDRGLTSGVAFHC